MEVEWNPPSFNGGSTITQYHIYVTPPPSADDSSCLGGQCTTTDMRFNVTGLDFNQQYNLSVRGENIAGIGESVSLSIFVIALGKLHILAIESRIEH